MPEAEFKVNRNAGRDDAGNGLNEKKGAYLCQCNRGMFSKQEIVISVGNRILYPLTRVFKLSCIKCSGTFVVLTRKDKPGCVSAFASSTEAEKLIEEARQEEWDGRFQKEQE